MVPDIKVEQPLARGRDCDNQWGWTEHNMAEITTIREFAKDLMERETALRGYL